MRFDVVLIRLVFTAILLAAGYVLHPIPGHRMISTATAGLVALAIIFFEMRIRRSSLKTLIGAAVGSILGIVGAYLIGSLIMIQQSISPEARTLITLSLRSEEHTSELQSPCNLVCRLLLEKKKL